MNKEKFLNFFNGEEQQDAIRIYNSLIMSVDYNTLIVVDEFVTPNIWYKSKEFLKQYNFKCTTYGFFENSERRMIAFSPSDWEVPIHFPYEVIRISNKSKFKKLEHKHYLGTLLSLGFKREKLGDLVVKEDLCFVPVVDDIVEYIINSLEKINGCAVKIEVLGNNEYNLIQSEIKQVERIVLSTSMRIDCIVSAITNISRSKADKLLTSGKVLVDLVLWKRKIMKLKKAHP